MYHLLPKSCHFLPKQNHLLPKMYHLLPPFQSAETSVLYPTVSGTVSKEIELAGQSSVQGPIRYQVTWQMEAFLFGGRAILCYHTYSSVLPHVVATYLILIYSEGKLTRASQLNSVTVTFCTCKCTRYMYVCVSLVHSCWLRNVMHYNVQ